MKIFFTFLLMITISSSALGQVAVIAHKSVPIDEINPSELLDFYTGDIRFWENEEPVIVFDFKPKGKLKDIFYKYLGKSTSRMK